MRGVPSLMRPRMTSSLPPAVSLDNRGPKVRALICGGRWQIPQDWAKTWRPNFCVAVNWSSVAACCADAPPATSAPKRTAERTAKRTAERTAALRFILNPPDIRFFASLRRRGGKRKARPRTRRLDRHAFQRGYRRRSSDARPGTRATGRLKRERASAHGPQNTKRPRGATRAAFLVSRPVALTTVVPSQRNHCSGRDARSNAQSQPLNTSEAPWGASLTTQMGHRPWCPFLLWSVSAWML